TSGSDARLALALESFALHFLEDAFAAGHIAGSWGKAAERKGTHDYYNQHGIDGETWDGKGEILFGDGYASENDVRRAGKVVGATLAQFVGAARPDSREARAVAGVALPAGSDGTFNVCTSTTMPAWNPPPSLDVLLAEVLRATPIPFRGPGYA